MSRMISRLTLSKVKGFTLIELVLTIVILGVLSASVIISMSARMQHSVITQADQFRRDLSRLQLLAISRNSRVRLTISADGKTYSASACVTSSCTNGLIDPATGLNFNVTLVDATLTPVNDALDFDTLGRPRSNGTLITDKPARIYVMSSSGRDVTVKVLPITGFAWLEY